MTHQTQIPMAFTSKPYKNEFADMAYCLNHNIKIYPVPTMASTKCYLEIDNNGRKTRGDTLYTNVEMWPKIQELYKTMAARKRKKLNSINPAFAKA